MYRTQLTGFLLVLLALVSANVVGAETEAQAAGQELTTAKGKSDTPEQTSRSETKFGTTDDHRIRHRAKGDERAR